MLEKHPEYQAAHELFWRIELHLRALGLRSREDQRVTAEHEKNVLIGYWLAKDNLEACWRVHGEPDGKLCVTFEVTHCAAPQETLWVSCDIKGVEGRDYWIFAGVDDVGGTDFNLSYFQAFVQTHEDCWLRGTFDEAEAFGWITLLAQAYHDYS